MEFIWSDGERTLQVTGEFIPGCSGARDSLGGIPGAGPPIEPDEPDDFEIETIEEERQDPSGKWWQEIGDWQDAGIDDEMVERLVQAGIDHEVNNYARHLDAMDDD